MLVNLYKSLFLLSLSLLLAIPFEAKALTKTWNGTSGNWSDGSKWMPIGAPDATDDVVIAAGTVTLDVAPTVATLTMNGGVIDGTNNLTITGDLKQSGGNLGNFGDISIGGIFLWSGGTVGNVSATATGTVSVAGPATLSGTHKFLWKKNLHLNGGGTWTTGDVSIGYNCIWLIPSGQTFSFNSAASQSLLLGAVPGTFEIVGTFQKLGAGVLTVNAPVSHSGTVSAQGGTLKFNGSGTYTGLFDVAVNDGIEFSNGLHSLNGITSSGNGTVKLSGGNLDLAGNAGLPGMNLTGGAVGGAGTLTIAGNLSLSNGNLGNVGDANVSGAFLWSGGTVGNAAATATGTVTIAGAATFNGSVKSLWRKTLQLNAGGAWTAGTLTIGFGGTLQLATGQTFTVNNAATLDLSSATLPATVNNLGTFVKQGAGTLNANTTFNNGGTIQVSAGILKLGSNGTYSGLFEVGTPDGLEFSNGTHTLNGTTAAGNGTVKITGGNVNLAGNAAIPGLNLTGGAVGGTGNLTIAGKLMQSGGNLGNEGDAQVNGTFAWTGGTVGNISATAGGVVTIDSAVNWAGTTKFLWKKTLVLRGGGSWTAGDVTTGFGALLRNDTTSNLTVSSATPLNINLATPPAAFENYGTFVKQGANTVTVATPFTNNGTTSIVSGILNLNNTFVNNGTIKGTGTLDLGTTNTNNGTFAPGLSPGTLTVMGNLTISTLLIETEGGMPVLHDSLHVSGNLTFASGSTLNVMETPCVPDGTYTILSWTGTRTGTILNFNLPAGYGLLYDDAQKKISLVVTKVEICNGIDDDCDGDVDEGFGLVFVGNLFLTTQADVDFFSTCYTKIEGSLTISGADIVNLGPLSNIDSITESLYVYNNDLLPNLDGLNGLTWVGQFVGIELNGSLESIQGLQGLTQVGGGAGIVNVIDNPLLQSLSGLEGLTALGSLSIINNPLLGNLIGVHNITTLAGALQVDGNGGLQSLVGLEGLTSVQELRIGSNEQLENLDALSNLVYAPSVLLSTNPALVSIEGLFNAGATIENLRIEANSSLTNLNGLENTTAIQYLALDSNPALENLNSLSNLSGPVVELVVYGNSALMNIDALSSVSSASLVLIQDNHSLNSLQGLDGLTQITGDLSISGNLQLADGCAIYPLLITPGAITGLIFIENNDVGCSSVAEIITYCSDADDDEFTIVDGDCDDDDPNTYPGATEICDNADNNCDGDVDEGVAITVVDVKTYLQGPYVAAVQLMHDSLRVKGMLPLTEPYTGLTNFTHVGGGGEATTADVLAVTGNNAIVDWVFLELRDSANPALVVATRSALLQRDGDVVDVDGVSPVVFPIAGDVFYFVTVRHRNHFGAQVTDPAFHPSCFAFETDFRNLLPEDSYQFNGLNPAQRLVSGKYVLWAGNGRVDYQLKYNGSNNDRNTILMVVGLNTPNASVPGYLLADYNLDGLVKYNGSSNDRNLLLSNVGILTPSAIVHDQIAR